MTVRATSLQRITSKTTRRYLTVALYAAVPPWIASVLFTMAVDAALSGRISATIARLFFASPLIGVPLMVGACTLATAWILQHTGRRAMDRWPLAGLVTCVLSLVFPVIASPWLAVWCIYSGYPLLTFAFTAYGWHRHLS